MQVSKSRFDIFLFFKIKISYMKRGDHKHFNVCFLKKLVYYLFSRNFSVSFLSGKLFVMLEVWCTELDSDSVKHFVFRLYHFSMRNRLEAIFIWYLVFSTCDPGNFRNIIELYLHLRVQKKLVRFWKRTENSTYSQFDGTLAKFF